MSCCCDNVGASDCPSDQWITLKRWTGSGQIPNDLRDILFNNESIWDGLDLEKYSQNTWLWRIVVAGTGDIQDLTELCMSQNRKPFQRWTAPIADRPESSYFLLSLDKMKWPSAPSNQHGVLFGGDFTISITVNSDTQTTPALTWNSTPSQVLAALQGLSNSSRCGTITVTGNPLDYAQSMTLGFITPLDAVGVVVTSSLIGSAPSILGFTVDNGSPLQNEHQMLEISWPASSGVFTLTVAAKGAIATTGPIPYNASDALILSRLNNLPNINPGDVFVAALSEDGGLKDIHVAFTGALANTDISPVTGSSSLIGRVEIKVTDLTPSDVTQFRSYFEPLNAGTIWNGFLRKAYGHEAALPSIPGNRDIRLTPRSFTENVGIGTNVFTITELSCGHGPIIWPGGCTGRSTITEWDVNGASPVTSVAAATFHGQTGTLQIDASLPFEFLFQIACVGCEPPALWGVNELSVSRETSIADGGERNLYEPEGLKSCGDLDSCRAWKEMPDNVPHTYRIKFGMNTRDAIYCADKAFTNGVKATRKTTCVPKVVLLGDGYFRESFYSRAFRTVSCCDASPCPPGTAPGLTTQCAHKPRREYSIEHPVSNIDRLRLIYPDFSYWGGWIDKESLSSPLIKCRFHEYDLTDVKVLFLGGLPMGKCPQTTITAGTQGGAGSDGGWIQDEPGDAFFYGDNSWSHVMEKDFESTALDPLKRWLDLGGRLLVLDGGLFPAKFYTTLGIKSTIDPLNVLPVAQNSPARTVSPNTLNGSWWTTPAWGPEEPIWTDEDHSAPQFQECYVDPEIHPFTQGIYSGITSNSEPYLVQEGLGGILGSSLAGFPIAWSQAEQQYIIAGQPARGVFNISQKFPSSYNHTGSGFTTHRFDVGRIPTAGLLAYTTAIPKITPSLDAAVVAHVRGVVPIAPWYDNILDEYITTPVDYPAIVAEPWRCEFQLKFTHLGTTEITSILPYNATASMIAAALMALPNIGSGLVVTGGPLPGSVDVAFSSASTTLTDVSLLEVVGVLGFNVETITEGSTTEDEVQRISGGILPSRILVHSICELAEPGMWGWNWDDSFSSDDATPVRKMSQVEPFIQDSIGVGQGVSIVYVEASTGHCRSIELPYYGRDGYHWGLGLSHIASKKFLENLVDFYQDF